jgi:hypothetical protein
MAGGGPTLVAVEDPTIEPRHVKLGIFGSSHKILLFIGWRVIQSGKT